ncbi:MAG: S26 family signal peptidase [Hyphomonas sp.]|nr:S26 family signal peptidase [Hyphomonas sp.]
MARDLRVGAPMPSPMLSPRAKVLILAGVLAGIGLAVLRPQDLILYNPSDSIPKGFYVRDGSELVRGSIVTIRSIHAAPDYAAKRNFTDAGDRFMKRIAAMEGDTVCAEGSTLSVNGKPVAERAEVDAAGDPLPSWTGCVTLDADQAFLLGDHPGSFDGRYWGISERANLIGPWRPLR